MAYKKSYIYCSCILGATQSFLLDVTHAQNTYTRIQGSIVEASAVSWLLRYYSFSPVLHVPEGGEAADIVDAGVSFESFADPLLLELGSRNVTGKRGKTIPWEGPARQRERGEWDRVNVEREEMPEHTGLSVIKTSRFRSYVTLTTLRKRDFFLREIFLKLIEQNVIIPIAYEFQAPF